MNDAKDYRGPDGKAKPGAWRRVWTNPQAAFDSVALDPYSASDFARVTNKRGGTVGDLWDRSKELSQQREAKDGKDAVKEKTYRQFAAKHHGAKHPQETREAQTRAFKQVGINVEWGD